MARVRVSIPYERENTCEPSTFQLTHLQQQKFPFPTNGKVHVNKGCKTAEGITNCVSIPYERESTCEPHLLLFLVTIVIMGVSIPYERESTCEPRLMKNPATFATGEFPFPTNGKVHVNSHEQPFEVLESVFPFPTNGKVHVNQEEGF